MCVLEMFLIDIYGLFFIWASSIKFQATKIWRVPAEGQPGILTFWALQH